MYHNMMIRSGSTSVNPLSSPKAAFLFPKSPIFFPKEASRTCPKKPRPFFISARWGQRTLPSNFPFERPGVGRAACPQAAARKSRVSFLRRVGTTRLTVTCLSGCQGQVGRFVPKPPRKISFPLLPGALGTARPTFQFPFERPGVGRAACPQAAARNLSLYPPIRCDPAFHPMFSLLQSLPFKRLSRFFRVRSTLVKA